MEAEWPGHGAIIEFLAHIGLRFEEFAALRWKDIDFDNKVIHVVRSASESGGARSLSKELKSSASRRELFLLEPAIAALERIREPLAQPKEASEPANADDWSCVVNNTKGGYISYSQWSKHLAKARSIGGVGKTAHDLRHIYASRLLATGLPVEFVARQLGHSNPRITLAVYRLRVPHLHQLTQRC